MSIVSNAVFSPEIINVSGMLMTVFLIIALIASLFLTDTKYWNKFVSDIFDMGTNLLLVVFAMIVIFKIMVIVMK